MKIDLDDHKVSQAVDWIFDQEDGEFSKEEIKEQFEQWLQDSAENLLEDFEYFAFGPHRIIGSFDLKHRQLPRWFPLKANESEAVAKREEAPNGNLAKTMADLVTPRQVIAIRAIGNDRHIDVLKLCLEMMKCKPEELSRKAASIFIDYLKALDEKSGQTAMTQREVG